MSSVLANRGLVFFSLFLGTTLGGLIGLAIFEAGIVNDFTSTIPISTLAGALIAFAVAFRLKDSNVGKNLSPIGITINKILGPATGVMALSLGIRRNRSFAELFGLWILGTFAMNLPSNPSRRQKLFAAAAISLVAIVIFALTRHSLLLLIPVFFVPLAFIPNREEAMRRLKRSDPLK
jgi:hypothetical protein